MQAMAGQRGAAAAAGSSRTSASREMNFRLRGQEKLTYTYLVTMTGNSGWIEYDLWSKNGGTDKKRVDIKVK
jgi:hypothetical protein